MTWWWLIPAIVLLAAVAMLLFGLRGRSVDDHPICRRCGFDLFGRPETSAVCGECGAALDKPRAIQIGRRERRGAFVAAGGTLLALTLLIGGAAGYAALTVNDWQPHKPAWWLLRELDDPAARGAATTELSKRLGAGKLAGPHVAAAVDKILIVQADAAATWVPALGDFVEDARRANLLAPQQWERFARQAPVHVLDVRRRVRHGDPIPLMIHNLPARVGTRTKLRAAWKNLTCAADGDGALIERRWGTAMDLGPRGGAAAGDEVQAKEYADRLAPGPHTLAVELEIEVQEGGQRVEDIVIAEQTIRLTAPFELLPPTAQPIKVIDNEALRGQMEKAVTPPVGAKMSRWQARQVDLMLNCMSAPVGIGYEVFAVVGGGREQRIKSIACAANKNHSWGASCALPDGLDAVDTIDLIYKPSIDAAAQTTSVYEIWGGTIVQKGIKVAPLPQQTNQPASASSP